MHQPLFVEMHKRLNQQPGLSHATMIVMGEKIMFAAVVKAADDRDALAVASGASDDVARHLDKVVRTAGWDQWHWPEPAE
jgi:formylmethanofuran dehydrogenase subunit A